MYSPRGMNDITALYSISRDSKLKNMLITFRATGYYVFCYVFSCLAPPPPRVTSCVYSYSDLPHILLRTQIIVVSSPTRPWIDVFALTETINMAVTESDLDPKVRKMSITF